jgi:tetratricopeptide (TPR) repeat protein
MGSTWPQRGDAIVGSAKGAGVATDRDWAHDVAFGEEAMSEFEHRLARARPKNRAQYLRVKGATLLGLEDEAALGVAVALLHRVVDEHDDWLEVPTSHELLGEAYRRLGQLDQAEHHYRMCLHTADESRNGTSNITELFIAELLLEQSRADEALELLDDEDLFGRLTWNADIYRYGVARSRAERATGGEPASWAREALRLAREDEPQLPHKPAIGRVRATEADLAELRGVVAEP